MVASMTGFGREVREDGTERIEVEVRSVNNRGLKVTVRTSDAIAAMAPDIENLVRRRVDRGTVHVDVTLQSLATERSYTINKDALRHYAEILSQMRHELELHEPLSIERIAALPGVIVPRPQAQQDEAALDARVRDTVEKALAALDVSRRREGGVLAEDLRTRLSVIRASLAEVRSRIPAALEEHRTRLRERMTQLLEGVGAVLDPQMLAREVAITADRTDISEEVTRLDAHVAEVERALASDGPVGRRLDFMAQEMLREANTMGSKSQDSALVQAVIAIKLEVDKIKEQVANVE